MGVVYQEHKCGVDDNNTHFFHRVVNSYRRTNHIRGMEVDGILYEDETIMCSQVVHFYQDLYTEADMCCLTMDDLEFSSIEEDERDFSKEEALQVLKEMKGDKKPLVLTD